MKFLLIAVLLLVVVDKGLSLKCYTCSGDKNCKSNEVECNTFVYPDPLCLKFEGKAAEVVAKMCTSRAVGYAVNQCKENNYLGASGTLCTCSTDLCNNANIKMISQYMMFALIFVAALFQFV